MAEDAKTKKVRRPKAQKRNIQSEKARIRHKAFRASVRTAIRKFDDSLQKGDAKQAKSNLNEIYSILDKGVKKGTYKLNTASRTKGRLAARLAAKA